MRTTQHTQLACETPGYDAAGWGTQQPGTAGGGEPGSPPCGAAVEKAATSSILPLQEITSADAKFESPRLKALRICKNRLGES